MNHNGFLDYFIAHTVRGSFLNLSTSDEYPKRWTTDHVKVFLFRFILELTLFSLWDKIAVWKYTGKPVINLVWLVCTSESCIMKSRGKVAQKYTKRFLSFPKRVVGTLRQNTSHQPPVLDLSQHGIPCDCCIQNHMVQDGDCLPSSRSDILPQLSHVRTSGNNPTVEILGGWRCRNDHKSHHPSQCSCHIASVKVALSQDVSIWSDVVQDDMLAWTQSSVCCWSTTFNKIYPWLETGSADLMSIVAETETDEAWFSNQINRRKLVARFPSSQLSSSCRHHPTGNCLLRHCSCYFK